MFRLAKRDPSARTDDRANANAQRVTMTLVLALVLPLLILWAVYSRQFVQITDMDAMDYAQVARNVAAGKGFVTSVVRPLATTHSTDILRMPDMIHPPLFAYAEAIVLATGASDTKVFGVSALFFLLTIPVLYALAKGMFNLRVAQLTVFAYMTSVFVMTMVLTAGPSIMAGFVFTSLCLVLFRYAQTAAPETGVPIAKTVFAKGALCGLMFALCYLTDYMLLFAFLPVAAFVYVAGRRMGRVGLAGFLAAFVVVAGAWMVRNMMVTGNPFFGMRAMEIGMNTTVHPGFSLYRTTVSQSVLSVIIDTKAGLTRKFIQGVQTAYSSVPVLGQPYLMAFLVAGLFYSFRRNGVNAVRGMLIGSLLCVAIFGSLFLFQMNTLTAFIPVMLAFGAAFFVRMLSDAKAPDIVGKGVSTLAVVVLATPLLISLTQRNTTPPAPRDVEAAIARDVKSGTPILTDRAFEMAWYGSRTTIWLPDTEKDVENLDEYLAKNLPKSGGLKAMYLSANLTVRTTEDFEIWRGMYGGVYNAAMEGKTANFDSGAFNGFELFGGLSEEQAGYLMSNHALLFLRPEKKQ